MAQAQGHMDVPSEPLGDFYWSMRLVKGLYGNSEPFSYRHTQVLAKINHLHVSDRWRHGCRRRALRDEFMACHWNESD